MSSPFRMCFATSFYQRPASRVHFFAFFNLRNLLYLIRSLEGISKRIRETKTQIDNILKLLNDAAEYRSSESNIKLQWIMMIVTVLSLFVALSSINNNDVVNEIKNLIEWIETIMPK